MYGLFVRHVHLVVWHEHGRSHGGMVLSWGWSSSLPAKEWGEQALLPHELVEFEK